MKTVLDIRRQLHELCDRVGVAITSAGSDCSDKLRQSLLSGLFVNISEHVGEGKYKVVSELMTRCDLCLNRCAIASCRPDRRSSYILVPVSSMSSHIHLTSCTLNLSSPLNVT